MAIENSQLNQLLDLLSVPIFRVDLNGSIIGINGRAVEIFGWSSEESLGTQLVDYIDPKGRDAAVSMMKRAAAGADHQCAFTTVITKEGKHLEILLDILQWRGEQVGVCGCIVFGLDVTELRQVTSVQSLTLASMQRLFETANAPTFAVDENGNVTMWNKKLASLTGYPREEAAGRPLVKDFISAEYKETCQKLFSNGWEADNFEFTLLGKTGKRIEILLNATAIRDSNGVVRGMLGIGQEITDLREKIKTTTRISDDLARVIDTANAPIFGMDTDGNVTEWNQKAAQLSGWSSAYAKGKPLIESFISPDHRPEVNTVLNMALLGHDTANFVFPLFTKDGQRKEISLNATARRGDDGQIIGVIGVGQDITKLNEMNAQYQRLAADWQRLIESANAPILGVDNEGCVSEWNAKAAEITGYKKGEAKGRPLVKDFIAIEHQKRVDDILLQALLGTETADFEFPLVTKDGKQIIILLNATTRRDETGAIVGVFGVGQDITNLKAAMTESSRIADELMRLIDTANAPIFGIDTNGCVNEWNAKAAEITGWPKQTSMGRPLVRDFIKPEHQSTVKKVLEDALLGKETANFEFPLATSDGRQIDILLNATTRRDQTGSVLGVLGVGQDITNLRAASIENSRIVDDLTRLIDTANAPIMGIDTLGKVTEWNQKAASITGYAKRDALGKNFVASFISEDFRTDVQQVLTKALAGTDTANFAFPMFTKDNRRREISLNATARRGANGEITGVIGVGQDVTELKQISAQNQRLAADWQRLIETANAPIFGVDINGNVNEWNAKVAEVTGFHKDEVIRRHLVRDFITQEHRARVQAVLASACSGKETANFEFPLATKNGKQIDILFNATTKRDEKGAVVGVFGVGQDITNLRTALTENSRIADDLTRLIDTANAPIFGIDTQGIVKTWNEKATEISGWPKQEAVGKMFVEEFISKGFRTQVSQVLTKALAGTDTANFTFPLFTKDGRRREISLNATARRGADGEIIGVIGVGQDITDFEQSRLEQKRIAEDYQRLIDTANAPIFGVNVEGQVTEWNRKAAEITGLSSDASFGRHMVNELISEEYKSKVQAVLEEACRGKDTTNFELPLIAKDGKQVDILLNATARRDPAGNPIGVVMVGQDITRLRQVINEVKFTADDLQRLIDTANAPIFGVNTQREVNEWNQMMATIVGFTKAEVLGKPFVKEFIMMQYMSEVDRVLGLALSGHETANYETPILTKDHQRRYILLNATTRRGADGEITGVIGVGQDFTRLKNLMEEQERVASDWMRLVDTANAPIFCVKRNLKVTVWNGLAAEISGYTKEEAEGMDLMKLVDMQYQESVKHVLVQACGGHDAANFEFPLMTKDGKSIYILLNATGWRNAQGDVVGAFCVGQDMTKLRETTIQTQAMADDLTRLIDTANAPIFGIDNQGLVTEWNRMLYKITGYDKESVLGKPMVQTFIHMDQQASVTQVFTKAMAGEEIANFELQLYTNNGQARDISINATPRVGSNGEITGVIGVGQDVTEVNIQRRALERSSENLRRIVDFANAPIIGVNVQCVVNEFNFKAAELSGFSRDEIMGRGLVQHLVSPEKRPSVSFALLQALSGEETSLLEFPMITKDGERRELTMNFTALRGVTGDMEGVICVGSDITELRQMSTQQKNIAEDFERIIRSANAPIIGVNVNGKVNEWNDKAAALSGFSKEEVMGEPLVETFIRVEDQPTVREAISKACRGVATTNFEFSLVSRDESVVLLLLNAATRTDASGNIVGMVGVGQDITTLRQAMDEIAANRDEITAVAEDLGRIIEHANAPILGIDTQGRVIEWNQKMVEITQYTKEEMMGELLVEAFIIEEYQVQVARVLKMALEGVETDNYEFSIVSKSGSRREILLNAATRRGPDGKVTGVIGVGQDITNIRAMTAENERVAEDLSRLIETANAPIFAVNAEGKITEWNRKCTELLGYAKEETMGQHLVRKFIHQVHRRSMRRVLNRALSNHEVANFELTFYTNKGEHRDILLSATPRWGQGDQADEINGVVCVGQDITEMKQHRDNAERVADDYSRLINTANAPIFGVDKDACITEWNNWVAVKSGFSKDETRGRKLVGYIADKSKEAVLNVLKQALKGTSTETFELELAPNPKASDEQKSVSLLLNATPRISPQGDIIGVTCVGQDITSIREMEQRKASFMAVCSHELKSPLNGIMGLSSGLVENAVAGSTFHKQLSLIQNCASRLLDMVNNIMDAGDLVQDKKMKFSADTVQLENIVEEVVVLCQNSNDRYGKKLVKEDVRLINEVTALPNIIADPHRCTQLVYNLVTNALKFTARGYVKVYARADEPNQQVIVTVEDTGIGIAQHKLESIFQPFEQEDQSSTRHYEGLGLGLAICKEVAVKHGGQLCVESEKDKGSKFHVMLPFQMKTPDHIVEQERKEKEQKMATEMETIHESDTPLPASTRGPMVMDEEDDEELAPNDGMSARTWRSESGEQSLEGNSEASQDYQEYESWNEEQQTNVDNAAKADLPPRLTEDSPLIVSVDDNEESQDMLKQWLCHNGFRVELVQNGIECLDMLNQGMPLPELILLDDLMPGKGGLDVLSDIRRSYSMVDLPIIMISSRNSTTAVVRGLNRQCNDWIHKPFDRRELLARVRAQIQLRDLLKEQMSHTVHCDALLDVLPEHVVESLLGGQLPSQEIRAITNSQRSQHLVAQQSAVAVDKCKQELEDCQQELMELQPKLAKARTQKDELERIIKEVKGTLEHSRKEQLKAEKSLQAVKADIEVQKRAKDKQQQQLQQQKPPTATGAGAYGTSQVSAVAGAGTGGTGDRWASQQPRLKGIESVTTARRNGCSGAPGVDAPPQESSAASDAAALEQMKVHMSLSRINAHLELDLRLRERQIQELQAKLRQHSFLAVRLQERCFELEVELNRARMSCCSGSGLPLPELGR